MTPKQVVLLESQDHPCHLHLLVCPVHLHLASGLQASPVDPLACLSHLRPASVDLHQGMSF